MEKVVVGISGGVDSSVAAYLLKQEGYEVIGLFMRNWDATLNNDIAGNPTLNQQICPQEQDYNDALAVCTKLGIELHRVDFIKEYWDLVFTYFLTELKKGRTPNPDLMCNKYIKFDAFIKEARKLGASKIATGHYAQIVGNKLLRGVDLNKDQTYFLAQLKPDQLKDVLFPVGKLTKAEVRKIALAQGLITAQKKDSTGICFIGERNYQKFIQNYLQPNPGPIINIDNNELIGEHQGLMNYTIGQRRAVGINGNNDRHFVCGKDLANNTLYVTFGQDSEYLYSDACLLEQVNFISATEPTFCTVKFRYRGADHAATLVYQNNNKVIVKYPGRAKAVTPGQACVFYLGAECLGSGIIKTLYKDGQKLWYL
ncbi:MAG TPA: tRNA 2-thiouridine(34) synthase MnmA [Bacilli bacterium]|nr:tRNA 2-thiouridine(34) synthase MnmA [Bacilli bacterium]